MDVYKIKEIVRKCCSSLLGSHDQSLPLVHDKGGSSLAAPCNNQSWQGFPDKVDMAEKNTTLRLLCQLLEAGFGVYAKQSFKMERNKTILDLLALNYTEATQIRIQIERDSDSTTIDSIHQDLKGIKSFQLAGSDYESYYKNKFGIIININWDSAFIKWWEDPKVESIQNTTTLTKQKEEIIGQLIDRPKKENDCVSGTFNMEKVKKGDGEYERIYGIQYLIFELNKEIITTFLPKN